MEAYERKEVGKQKRTWSICGFVVGFAVCACVCAWGLGLERPSTALQHEQIAVQTAQSKLLAPSCAAQFLQNKVETAKFVAAQKAGYGSDEVVGDTVKSVQGVTMNDILNGACVAAITKRLKAQAKNTASPVAKKS